MANNDNVVTRGSTKSTTITRLLFNVGNNGTFGDGSERKNVTNLEGSLSTGIDKLASSDTFVGNEGLFVLLITVRIAENDLGERSTSTGVVNNLLNNTTDKTFTLSVIKLSELGSSLS